LIDFTYGGPAYPANERLTVKALESFQAVCSGLTSVFVSAMRANKIPARYLMGKVIHLANDPVNFGDDAILKSTSEHAKAEFFVTGLGWVPAEPTLAGTCTDENFSHWIHRAIGFDVGRFFVKQVANVQGALPDQLKAAADSTELRHFAGSITYKSAKFLGPKPSPIAFSVNKGQTRYVFEPLSDSTISVKTPLEVRQSCVKNDVKSSQKDAIKTSDKPLPRLPDAR